MSLQIPLLSFWHLDGRLKGLTGVGNAALLGGPMIAFFASRTCPGSAIRAAMDWAVAEARSGRTVISGFHSPLERSVLEVLLTARSKAVIALARDVGKARLPAAWRQAVLRDEIAIVSVEPDVQRLTEDLASLRNDWVAALADNIVIGHAEPGGGLERAVCAWNGAGRAVRVLTQSDNILQ